MYYFPSHRHTFFCSSSASSVRQERIHEVRRMHNIIKQNNRPYVISLKNRKIRDTRFFLFLFSFFYFLGLVWRAREKCLYPSFIQRAYCWIYTSFSVTIVYII